MKNNILIKKFVKSRKKSIQICKNIELEDYSLQPHEDISPPKWHLAHTSWFYEEVIIIKNKKNKKRYNDKYKLLFNSYYKYAGSHWEQNRRGLLSRPTVKEIIKYRNYVDKEIIKFIKNSEENFKQKYLIEIGIHHEEQHQELLLMDIKYILGVNPDYPIYKKKLLSHAKNIQVKGWKEYKEGIYEIGHKGNKFAYDNEKPNHKKYMYSYKINKNFVSNAEFKNFIQADAYKKPKYWLSKGWDWIAENKVQSPLYWHFINNKWYEFTLYGLRKIGLNLPVSHISYYEASAYARWANCRLPTEEESEILLKDNDNDQNNRDKLLHAKDLNKIENNLWWWTNSHYSPYPGYTPYRGILGEYNEKFMCSQFVLKGGAVITPIGHHRFTYRNFFEPHQRWMFSGIRLAKDLK